MKAIAIALAVFSVASVASAAPLRVGSKRFTESYVLAEVVRQVATSAGEDAVHVEGLGGTAIVFRALEAGEIDVYPEYTGTVAEAILHDEAPADVERLRRALAPKGIGVSAPLGFTDSYALAMRRKDADARGVHAISDLATHGDLRIALSHEFLGRSDGWPGLAARYRLPETPIGMDHGLAYVAIEQGRVDVVDVYSTDAKIAKLDLAVLADNRGFFPPYEAVLLYRLDAPARFPRGFGAIDRLAGRIDQRAMIAMNAAVELEGATFAESARRFLDGKAAFTGRRSLAAGILHSIATHGPRHLLLSFLSLAAAIAAGIPLGLLAARLRRGRHVLLAVTGAVQTIPSLALLCFFVPLLGTGVVPALVALFVYGLLPIVRSTVAGLDDVPPQLREAAEAIGLPPRTRLFRVYVPMASRAILAGVKTSAVVNVGTATLAAFIGAGGFGEPISTGLNLDDSRLILEGAIPAALLAILVQALFDALDRWLVPRGLRLAEERRLCLASAMKLVRLVPIALLALASCGEDGQSGSICDDVGCRDGVSIQLGALASKHASAMPLAIHVCFDQSCDDVTLSRTARGLDCGGEPGVGAPDQLTSCFVNDGSNVEIDIGRTDGKSYDDGKSHVIAASVRGANGDLVFSAARSVTLPSIHPVAECPLTCNQATVPLAD